jgi:hypothetical protein
MGHSLSMNETNSRILRKILAFAAVVEVGTGVALIVAPAIVVALLLGANEAGPGLLLGRFLGIALLALGMACWPGGQRAASSLQAFQAMLIYNLLVALFLAYVGTAEHLGGPLLWPGVVLHAAVALLLVWTWRTTRQAEAPERV